MSDFPSNQLPLFISSFSTYALSFRTALGSVTGNVAFTWVANQAVYLPVTLPWEYPVNRVWWANGSTITTSNADFGIYTPSGARIYSTGSTALSGASVPQYVTPSTPFVLPAGQYYFAYVCSGTTNRSFGSAIASSAGGALAGMMSQATALPLPATATFATYVTPGAQLCGITRTQSGF